MRSGNLENYYMYEIEIRNTIYYLLLISTLVSTTNLLSTPSYCG